jgi:hypothetical protein
MNMSELSWLLRERIELDVMEEIATGSSAVDTYNDRVRDYNRLAAAIQYKDSDMKEAERLVESMKLDIVREAESRAMELSLPSSVKGDPVSTAVWYVQKYLKLFGYYPGEANGVENEGTVSALKMYQIKKDVPVTGTIDEQSVSDLREQWLERKIPRYVGFGSNPADE